MFQAQLLMSGTDVYSPWFKRGGDGLRATLDFVAQSGGNVLTVRAFTKNEADTGDGTDAISAVTITASTTPGRFTSEWLSTVSTGLKELVRYKFSLANTASGWALFRMLPPVWFDAVKI